MASMIHSRPYNPVLFQKIRVSTELYGVMCKVFYPLEMPDGFMNYSNIEYSTKSIDVKLLIPRAVIRRHNDPFTDIEFSEEETYIWSVKEFPRYSKITVTEISSLISFIVTEIETTKDSRLTYVRDDGDPILYYKYTLVPSSSILPQESISGIEDMEIDRIDQEEFTASIEDINKQPNNKPNSNIKVGKL